MSGVSSQRLSQRQSSLSKSTDPKRRLPHCAGVHGIQVSLAVPMRIGEVSEGTMTKSNETKNVDIAQLRKITIILDLVRENMEEITDVGNHEQVSGAQVWALAWLVRFCVEGIEKLTEGGDSSTEPKKVKS